MADVAPFACAFDRVVMFFVLFLFLQRDIWRASASAVLSEFWDVDERVVHLSVWPRLLLENPLAGVLRLHPGTDAATPQHNTHFRQLIHQRVSQVSSTHAGQVDL